MSDGQSGARSEVLGGPRRSPRAQRFTTRTQRTQRSQFTLLLIPARHKGTDRLKSAAGGPGPELTSLPARCLPALTCPERGDGGPALPGVDLASSPPAVKLKPPGRRPPVNKGLRSGHSKVLELPSPQPKSEGMGLRAPWTLHCTPVRELFQQDSRLTHYFKSRSGTSLTSPLFPWPGSRRQIQASQGTRKE